MKISEIARNNYTKWDEQFCEILVLLMMFTCGLSGRGTEMTSLHWMNTMDGDRSIYIEDKQLMFITEYHTSMVLMHDQKVEISVLSLLTLDYPTFLTASHQPVTWIISYRYYPVQVHDRFRSQETRISICG